MKVSVKAYAKLNLTLDITGKREDGYHLLKTVMQSVSLYDTVTVRERSDGQISLSVTGEEAPEDSTNTAWKAAERFFEYTGVANPGIGIKIDKNIPVGSGLAGGSADAAGVIIALDRIFGTRLDEDELCDIAEKVGADVPFCVTGGTALARGTGSILSFLPDLADCRIVIARGSAGMSTKEAYALFDAYEGELVMPDSDKMCEDICGGDIEEVADGLCNVFEQALGLEEPARLISILRENGALGAALTGSGSAVFGIFEDEENAQEAADALEKECEYVFVKKPAHRGVKVLD